MFVSGAPIGTLFSIQDYLLQSIWCRNRQIRTFETLINVLASGIAINPDVTKRIDELTNEYFELVLPGSKDAKRKSDESFAEKTSKALADVASLLARTGSSKLKKNFKPL